LVRISVKDRDIEMGTSALVAQNAQTLINMAASNAIPIALSGSNVSLTKEQLNSSVIALTGTLSANIVLTVPTSGLWTFFNNTTGDFTVTLSNGSGATQALTQGAATAVLSTSGNGILVTGSSGVTGGVQSFNTRTGAIVLQAADLTSVGGALLASPIFTGVPLAPTAVAGTANTQLATTGFVAASFAPLASPALTGTPTAPTVGSTSDNSTKIATTAFVQSLVATIANGLNIKGAWDASTNSPTLASGVGVSGTFYKVSVAGTTNLDGNSTWDVGDIALFADTTWVRIPAQATAVDSFNTRTGAITLQSADVTGALGFTPANATAVAGLAPLASPALTGIPTAPTAAAGTNTTQLATTSFVVTSYAPLASPTLTGIPKAPTAATGTNTTQIATTAFVQASMGSFAPVVSPAFTGVPTAPTATAGTATTQLATTAFVGSAVSTVVSTVLPKSNPVMTGRAQSDAYSYTVINLGSVSGTQTLNLAAASEWTATIAGSTTFAFTNTLAANTSEVVMLRLTNAGAFTITWPANTKFAAKTAPVFTSSGVDLVGVQYDTVSATYMVFVIGLNIG
jgi:hypothetical protein